MDNYQSGTFGFLTLLSAMNLFTLVLVFTHRVHTVRDLRVMGLLTMAIAISGAWSFSFREWRRALPTSDAVLYKKLANTIFSLSFLMNFCAQAGISLSMYR
jgi:hypothetical protein